MEPELSEKLCPRCKVNHLYKIKGLNAVSRYKPNPYICPPCGTDEALTAFFGEKPDLGWLQEVSHDTTV